MDLRSDSEVREAFARAISVLDPAFELARPALLRHGVSVRSMSNRSGFDKSGFGHPSWRYVFERRSATVSPIVSVAVAVSYDEPIWLSQRGELTAVLTIEVFHLGAAVSLFRAGQPVALSLDGIQREGLLQLVLGALEDGISDIPAEYRPLIAKAAPAQLQRSPFE